MKRTLLLLLALLCMLPAAHAAGGFCMRESRLGAIRVLAECRIGRSFSPPHRISPANKCSNGNRG